MGIQITVMYLWWYSAFLFRHFCPLWWEKANSESVTEVANIHILILSRCIDSGKNDVSITFRRYYLTPVYYSSSLEANVSHFTPFFTKKGLILRVIIKWEFHSIAKKSCLMRMSGAISFWWCCILKVWYFPLFSALLAKS